MPSRKPTLVLSTPVTASFPAEALKSAASVRTPHSAFPSNWRESAGLPSAGFPSAGLPSAGLSSAGLHSPMVAIKTEEGLMKTPISPPIAYMDFLKLASPVATSPCTSSPVTSSSAATAAHPTTSSRPKILHRASISGPVKATGSNLSTSTSAAAINAAAAASSTSLSSVASSNSDEESSSNDAEDKDTLDSGPSTAASASSSTATDCCSCDVERAHKSPKIARIDTAIPPSPFGASNCPMSAPPIGRTTFPSLKIPVSPAISNVSQINSPIRSPFSAKSTSITSPFDWESALKARYAEFKSPKTHAHTQAQARAHTQGCSKCTSKTSSSTSTTTTSSSATAASTTTSAKTSIRHIREVVTRTVTYTPRMDPPPKGKKRKMDCDETAC